jgi:hypothetical protein
MANPTKLTIRAYQVGFGDCFLLTFHYPAKKGNADDRHVLIDFGSVKLPKSVPNGRLRDIAVDIKKVCSGNLDAVVVTHRHRDHLSGFATDKKTAGGKIIASLNPKLIIQPWTEDPQARPDARKPTQQHGSRQFVQALADMQQFSSSVVREALRADVAAGRIKTKRLSFLGENNLKNASAVKNLMTMGKEHRYVSFGDDCGLDDLLPGVKVHVLGPPTLEQSAEIKKERHKDADEFWHIQPGFWHFQAATGRQFLGKSSSPFPNAKTLNEPPIYARWFLPRLDNMRGNQLFEIVRILDKAMNNTSVILLFEVGGKKLLFPGDAQIENWSYALAKAKTNKKLASLLNDVDLYKVGHHGSLNATPKSLWARFRKKSAKTKKTGRLETVVSTLPGVYGNKRSNTEVPRTKLIAELKCKSAYFSTEQIKEKQKLCELLTIILGS